MQNDAKFIAIKQKFLERLEEWLPAFQTFLHQVKNRSATPADVEEILLRVHRIAGSARTFAVPNLSEAAAAAELHLHRAKQKPSALVEQEGFAALEALLEQLQNPEAAPAETIVAEAIAAETIAAETIAAETAAADPPPLQMPGRHTILVADDDDLVRELVVNEFSNADCTILQAGNGPAVLDMVRIFSAPGAARPDLILLDVNMPGMDGFTVLQQLKATPATADIPVVMLTRQDADESVIRGISCGATDYITKPFATGDLLSRIAATLTVEKHKILLADDDDLIRELLVHRFARSGVTVLTAKSGSEALLRVRQERPDLVLLDVMMPGMSGISVLKQMKAEPELRQIPVVLLSAKIQQENILLGLDSGAHDYITKPFDSDEVFARVKGILRRNKSA